MSQDKRDKNNADRDKSSAKADETSKSSGAKPSEAAASKTDRPSSTGAGKPASTPANPGPSGSGTGNNTSSADPRASSSGGKSAASAPPGGTKPEAGSASPRADATKAGAGQNRAPTSGQSGGAKRGAADKNKPTDNASPSAGKASGTSGDSNDKAGKSETTTAAAGSAAAGSASGKSGSATTVTSGDQSSAPASAGARSSTSNTGSGSASPAGKNTQSSSTATGTSAPSSAGGGRSGGPATGGPKNGGPKNSSKGLSIGLVVAVVALIVAILAAAASGYLWYRGQQRIADLDSRINTVEKGLQSNVQKVVMPKLANMRDQLSQFSQRTDQLSQKLDQRKQQIAQLQQTIEHVQAQNTQLSDQLGGDHGRFVAQRIALLLEAANQRLQVERDPKGAAQALALADQAIQRSGDPELHPVRAKIADEMAALKALPDPDIEGLSLKLSNAIQQVPKLPLQSNVPSSYQSQSRNDGGAASGDSDNTGGDDSAEFAGIKLAKKWHQLVDSVGNALSRMVTIRRANGTEDAPALMAPDQSYFLVQNLQLQLRTARLALLNGNTQTYHDALSDARDWIQKYFDTSDSSVSAILDDLSQLSHVKLDWQAPDLSSSLNTLRQIMDRDQSDDSGSSSAGEGQSGGAGEQSQGQPAGNDTDSADAAGSS